MSVNGSASSSTRSAAMPSSTLPCRWARPRCRAGSIVAARSASSGDSPASVSRPSSSCSEKPGKTYPVIVSVPASSRTPAAARFAADRDRSGGASAGLSVTPGRIASMDVTTVVAVVSGLLIGMIVGAAVAGLVLRSRSDARTARDESRSTLARAELAQAQTLAAEARSESAQARAELAQARADVAEARALASAAQAEAAEVGAQVAKAVAERDAAVRRAEELAADRESMLNQFKVLSGETIEKQTKFAEASAEARLKATEQLMAPVRESLERFNARLTEVEKERVRLDADLRNQVQTVQLTGEQLRRETHALATALRKPHVRGAWGEMQLKRVAEIAGMIEHCDFSTQHSTSSNDRAVRPDMRVELAEGKCVFV